MEEKKKEKPHFEQSHLNKELLETEKQFKQFDEQIQQLTMDRMNKAPMQDIEPQTKIANRDIDKKPEIYLKPFRSIGGSDKFNEKFRSAYIYDKEYVHFIAENKEVMGETIDIWTRPYGGVPAEWWKVPVNKPVWGPRYLAEQIRRKTYHRLIMDSEEKRNNFAGQDTAGHYYGVVAVDTTIARLSSEPVSSRRSVFMSAKQEDFNFDGKKAI